MVDFETFKSTALSFPEATESPHFEKTSFRVKTKIFATYDAENQSATLKFNPVDQSAFCSAVPTAIYPVNNAWGKQGWTIFQLNAIDFELLQDALKTAYCHVAPKKLAAQLGE